MVDFLLPHLLTVMNSQDWHYRAAFFQHMVSLSLSLSLCVCVSLCMLVYISSSLLVLLLLLLLDYKCYISSYYMCVLCVLSRSGLVCLLARLRSNPTVYQSLKPHYVTNTSLSFIRSLTLIPPPNNPNNLYFVHV